MIETHAGWQVSLKLLVWVAFVTLYWLGGRSHRWLRWFVGGLVFAGGLIGVSLLFHTFHWRYLISLIVYPLSLARGYGSEQVADKLRRRLEYGLWLGLCSLSFVTTTGLLFVSIFQTVVAVLASVLFGVLNPFKDAPSEESAIAACSTVLVPMMGG